jgi:photosystem II stability/assembly factor-like uncharacterized protein
MKPLLIFILLGMLTLSACNLPTGQNGPVSTTSPSAEPLSTPLATAARPAVPLQAPSLPAVVPSALIDIDFLDPYNGWGLAADGSGMVLRSVDGGRTWFNATPPGSLAIGYSSTLSVLDAVHAWLLLPNQDFYTGTLYRTADGGQTWNSDPVPFGGRSLQFLDASTGRILADRGAGAGSQAVELYQTSDGGVSWVSVFHNDPTQAGSSDSLPLSGDKTGMTFVDARTGWVTGSIPMDGNVYLYVTHDGGATWSQQAVPLPPGYESYQYMTNAPIFFGSYGLLPLYVYPTGGNAELTFYVSTDGGASWSGDPRDANRVITPGSFSFSDASNGHSWDGGPNLYVTADGTRTWGGLGTSLDLSGSLAQLDFTDASTGWALTGPDSASHSQLYHTTDGGFTWTALLP